MGMAEFTDPIAEDEDCLVVNVWTPDIDPGAHRPVMVWFHGGGFAFGSGSVATYDGTNLAKRGDVIVVTVNHRLGILGHLHLAGVLGNGRYAASGNAGVLDLCAALQWVQDNISGFGGDPSMVTIFGQSGGGQKVGTVMAMPAAKGTFHRAVCQSGFQLRAGVRVDGGELTEFVLAELGLSPAESIKLRELPVERLLEVQGRVTARFGVLAFGPCVDGVALPLHPEDAIASGVAADVPLLVGTTSDEFRQAGAAMTGAGDDAARAMLAGLIGRADSGCWVDEPLARYRRYHPEIGGMRLFGTAFTDWTNVGAVRAADQKVTAANAPVFMYVFAWSPGGGAHRVGAFHGAELRFVFDNLEGAPAVRALAPPDLVNQVSEAWLAFARTGDPNHPGLLAWPQYNCQRRPTMVFDDPCHTSDNPHAAALALWDGLETVH
jgi:para-nitrobenzyl esterase